MGFDRKYTEFDRWCFKQHDLVNHTYDGLPYHFHLRLAIEAYYTFDHLLAYGEVMKSCIRDAVAAHDLIEDCRITYNDLFVKVTHTHTADIVYAVTNEKGRTREERANDKYYEGIVKTPGAVFVKLCDRIANINYGMYFNNSRMLDTYRKEQENFKKKLGYSKDHELAEMFHAIDDILNK